VPLEPSEVGLKVGRLFREQDIRCVRFAHLGPCGARLLVRASVLQTDAAEFDPLAPHLHPPVPPVEGARLIHARARCNSERADD